MKVVILAGGLGTRLSEETDLRPKPMVEVGGRPILWHIMKIYSYYGYNEFIVCLGYKGYVIKEYFHHYYMHQSDVTIDLGSNTMDFIATKSEPWKITLVDTGLETMTGGRLLRIQRYVGTERFMLTYGDGLSDVDIGKLVAFHDSQGKLATMTAVQPQARFGAVTIGKDGSIDSFKEKPKSQDVWINGGFFVLEHGIFQHISEGDETIWERKPLETLARDHEIAAFKHEGYWQPMDTLREKRELEAEWSSGCAPWKVWDEADGGPIER